MKDKTQQLEEWLKKASEQMMPGMKSSSIVLSIYPTNGLPDPKFCLELGAALMMDKPLLLVASDETPIPQRLRDLATRVVTLKGREMSGENAERVRQAVHEMLKGRKE